MKVSVICPLYKGNKYLVKIIEMVKENRDNLGEKNVNIEVIFINDYPEEMINIEKYNETKLEIKLINNIKNMGIHYSRVNGVNNCDGDYILFLDQDDEISNEYISSQLSAIGKYDAVVCNGYNRGCEIYNSKTMIKNVCKEDFYFSGKNPIVSPGQVLLRRQAISSEWKEWQLKNNGADDYFLWMLMFIHKKRMIANYKMLYRHNTTGANTSNNWNIMKASVYEMIEKLYTNNLITNKQAYEIRKGYGLTTDDEDETLMKYEKNRRIASTLDIWLTHKENGRTCRQFMIENDYMNVIVYGYGILGKHLVCELEHIGIKIEGIIDMNCNKGTDNIPNIKLGEEIMNSAVIIVTPVINYEDICADLNKLYNNKIIHISEIVDNMK